MPPPGGPWPDLKSIDDPRRNDPIPGSEAYEAVKIARPKVPPKPVQDPVEL